MKLPGTLDFGVQQLGRPDKGAMRAKASAEQGAALAWGDALNTASTEFAKVAEATGLADANLTLSERVSMDKKSTAELDQYLASTPAINLDLDDVPAAVREAAVKAGFTEGMVDTYEIAIEASKHHFEASQAASVAAMGEKNQSKQAITSYNKQMDNVWAGSAQSATKTHIVQRIAHLSARSDLLHNEAINNLDEFTAMQVIVEAEQSGAWTPEYAGTKMAALGSTIDQVAATRMYRDATTQEELDQADLFTDRSRIEPTERMAMMKLSDQMQDRQHTLEMRKQPINYSKAQAKLIEGTLTKNMVAEMARNQDISGGQANTLRTALNTPVPLLSVAGVMDRFMGEAAILRYSDEGDPTKITDRAEGLRESVMSHFTGLGKDGNSVPRSLTGKDLDTLMQLIGKYENEALGKGGQQYAVAARSMKALTGYSDAITAMIEGKYPAGLAYADFNSALQEYMDIDGTDPSNFVAQNASRFTADVYAEDIHKRLAIQFPQYSKQLMELVNPVSIENATVGSLLFTAQMDYLGNRLPEEDYDTLVRGLDYLVVEQRMEAATQSKSNQILPGAQ